MSTHKASDLAMWCHGEWRGELDAVAGFTIDTRTAKAGELFIALKGERDGHTFVSQAFERGVAGAVVERAYANEVEAQGPLLVVEDTRQALQDVARGYRSTLKAEIVGITGSVGKTTVKEMVADVLGACGSTTRTKGNWNNDIGLPLSIMAMKPTDKFGVFEMGISHPGEMETLCSVAQPTEGVMTPIGPAHLEYFDGLEHIADEKARLFEALPSGGVAVQSLDDPWHHRMSAVATCRMVTVSMHASADYMGQTKGLAPGHFRVTERETRETAVFEIPIQGEFIVEDALFAIALGRLHGLGWDDLRQVIQEYRSLPMRWTSIDLDGIEVINDAYNANPMSMRASLAAFAGMQIQGRKWLVLGGMHELGATERDEHLGLGREIAKGNWAGLIVTGTKGVWIADGSEASGLDRDKIFCCEDQAEAAELLERLTSERDAVLLKASRGEELERVLDEWRHIKCNEASSPDDIKEDEDDGE